MATVSHSFDSQNQSSFFTPEQQRQMMSDDLLAGRSVSAVLVSVVGLGLALMLLTVYYVCR